MPDTDKNPSQLSSKALREKSFAELKQLAGSGPDGTKEEILIPRSADQIRVRLYSDNRRGGIPLSHPLIIVTLEGQHAQSEVVPREIARFSFVEASHQWRDAAHPAKAFTVDELHKHLLLI